MIVAVAALRPSVSVAPFFPPQQSPMLGHRASSQTVWSPSPLRSFLILLKDAPDGIDVLRWAGSRGLCIILYRRSSKGGGPCVTHPRMLPRTMRSGTSPETNSSREGPSASV